MTGVTQAVRPLRHRMMADLAACQMYLASEGISWPALNQTVCPLRFFYV
jgi:hypothetical protein